MRTISSVFGWAVAILLFSQSGLAQQKRSLTHADYDSWESLSAEKITKNGKFVGYQISPQDGDGRVEIFPFKSPNQKISISRGTGFVFTADDTFALGKIVAQKDSVYALKIKKKKGDDLPKDSLFLLNLASGNLEKLPRVKSFATPSEKGSWVAIHFEKELVTKDTGVTDSTQKAEKPKKTEGTKLLVRSLDGKLAWELDRVKSYNFSPNGDYLYYLLAEEEKEDNTALHVLELASGEQRLVHEKMTTYTRMAFSSQSSYLSFVISDDSAKAKKPSHKLLVYDIKKQAMAVEIDKDALKLENSRISPDASIRFSEDESRLFFGVAQEYQDYAYENDSTLLDEQRVSLDIWGWQDAEIQPMQLKKRSQEEKKSYLAVLSLNDFNVLQLGTPEVDEVQLENKITKDKVLAWTDAPYRRSYSWDIQLGRDLYLIDLVTGSKQLIEKNVSGSPRISPASNYVYWYDGRDSAWVAFDLKSKAKISFTKNLPVAFYDELHDSPSLPGSYGAAGWLAGDEAFLVNDRYDLWKIDPRHPEKAQNITLGEGRKNKIIFRRERLKLDEEFVDPKELLILSAFEEIKMRSGFYLGDYQGKNLPKQFLLTDHRYAGLKKAEKTNQILVRRSTYQENPDLYLGDLNFSSLLKASSLNPQQANIKWGNVKLVSYLTQDGTPLQGLLFTPEGFDGVKKFPMMVYITADI